jgi:hypothetical protein
MARPSGVKWAAIKAEHRMKQPIKKRRIDFGYTIPFINIPKLVEDGFK